MELAQWRNLVDKCATGKSSQTICLGFSDDGWTDAVLGLATLRALFPGIVAGIIENYVYVLIDRKHSTALIKAAYDVAMEAISLRHGNSRICRRCGWNDGSWGTETGCPECNGELDNLDVYFPA